MSNSSNNLVTKSLIDFGLSEKEARAYLALLELGTAKASEVAQTADLKRSSAYVILESLKKQNRSYELYFKV